MGSIARQSALERFIATFGQKIEEHFQHLVGAEIVEMTDKEVAYHVKALVTLKTKEGDKTFEVHHRWANLEEDADRKEFTDYPMEAYFEDYLKGQVIEKVTVGLTDRDDEVYLLATVKNGEALEIPIGFDPECGMIHGIAEEILTEEEMKRFIA